MSDSTDQVLSWRFNTPNAFTVVRIVPAVVIAVLLTRVDVI